MLRYVGLSMYEGEFELLMLRNKKIRLTALVDEGTHERDQEEESTERLAHLKLHLRLSSTT
jgi:hypothetical protein